MKIILFAFLQTLVLSAMLEMNSPFLNGKVERDLTVTNETGVCSKSMLQTYGLTGYTSPVRESNSKCPSIEVNCCSA